MLPHIATSTRSSSETSSHFHGSANRSCGGRYGAAKSDGWALDPAKVLDSAEVERVLATARRQGVRGGPRTAVRDWFLAELALSSGLRVSELAALVCGDLVLGDHPVVAVRCGKGRKARTVRVGSALREAARRFLEWKREVGELVDVHASVFLNERTGRHLTPRALQQSWARTLCSAGVEHRGIHSARHTYATHLLKASRGNLRLVQRQLGHASIATTQVYLGLFTEEVEEAVEGLYERRTER